MLQIRGSSKPCPQGTNLHEVPCTTLGKHCCADNSFNSNPVLTDFTWLCRETLTATGSSHLGQIRWRDEAWPLPLCLALSGQCVLNISKPLPPQAVHGQGAHRRDPGITKLHGSTSNDCLINVPPYQRPQECSLMTSFVLSVDWAGLTRNLLLLKKTQYIH